MLDVEQFVRLMLGEALRGDETARSVGGELMAATASAIERWLKVSDPDLAAAVGAPEVGRVVRAFLIGTFFEYVAGVMDGEGDPGPLLRARANEAARVLKAGRPR
jgi:hypothetical protein